MLTLKSGGKQNFYILTRSKTPHLTVRIPQDASITGEDKKRKRTPNDW